MKLASFISTTGEAYGIVQDDFLLPATVDFLAEHRTLQEVIATGAYEQLHKYGIARSQALPLSKVKFLPPIPNPGKIICAGLNYRKPHPIAGVTSQSENIIIFSRHPESLVGHEASLEIPLGKAANTFDYEGEIVAVIGKPGRHIDVGDAASHVLGYAAMNEGSVRGWQKHCLHAGKNFFSSGAWGPWITTADEFAESNQITLTTRLNGKPVQHTSSRAMIVSLPKLVAYISHLMPLGPGDVIATGSPDGTGSSRIPPRFLQQGDVVEVEVSGVGVLRNRVGKPSPP